MKADRTPLAAPLLQAALLTALCVFGFGFARVHWREGVTHVQVAIVIYGAGLIGALALALRPPAGARERARAFARTSASLVALGAGGLLLIGCALSSKTRVLALTLAPVWAALAFARLAPAGPPSPPRTLSTRHVRGLQLALALGLWDLRTSLDPAKSGIWFAVLAGALALAFAGALVLSLRPRHLARLPGVTAVAALGRRDATLLLAALAACALWTHLLTRAPVLPLAFLGVWNAWALGLFPATAAGLRRAWIATGALALAVRVAYVVALPLPGCGPDSPSYLKNMHAYLAGAPLEFYAIRTPVFSVYTLTILAVTGSYVAYLVLTHLLGFGIALGVGRLLRRRWGEVAGLFAFAALGLSPRLVHYEHMLLAESTLTWALIGTCALAVSLQDRAPAWATRPATAFGLGVCGAVATLVKPIAFPALAMAGVAALAKRWPPSRVVLLVVGGAAPLLAWCLHNALRAGFFGLTTFTGLTLFGTVGHVVDAEPGPHLEIRQELQPGIARHNAEFPWWDPDINYLMYSGEGPAVTSVTLQALDEAERHGVMGEIAWVAIRRHPDVFFGRALYQVGLYGQRVRFWLPGWERQVHDQVAGANGYLPGGAPYASAPWAPQRRVYTYGVAPYSLLAGWACTPLEHPLTGLLIMLIALRARRDRWFLLTLGGMAAAMAAITCLLVTPTARFYVQTFVPATFAAALLLQRLAYSANSRAPNQRGL